MSHIKNQTSNNFKTYQINMTQNGYNLSHLTENCHHTMFRKAFSAVYSRKFVHCSSIYIVQKWSKNLKLNTTFKC